MTISKQLSDEQQVEAQLWKHNWENTPDWGKSITFDTHRGNSRSITHGEMPKINEVLRHNGQIVKVVAKGDSYTVGNSGRNSRGYTRYQPMLTIPATQEELDSWVESARSKAIAKEQREAKQRQERIAQAKEIQTERLKDHFGEDYQTGIYKKLRSLGVPYPDGMRRLSVETHIETNVLWDAFKGNL